MRQMIGLAALALAIAPAGQPAAAQTTRSQNTIHQVIVYGSDPCPRGSGEEITVCARRPESERYRIPPNLRTPPPSPQNESWAEKAQALETQGRTGTMSCSPVGPGGYTGCLNQLIAQARAERKAARQEQKNVP